jgi:hypothetical protein
VFIPTLLDFKTQMPTTNSTHKNTEKPNTTISGGITKKYPFPLIKDEKLDTQNGIKNRRNVCHLFSRQEAPAPTLIRRAIPMIALIPKEFNHIQGDASK